MSSGFPIVRVPVLSKITAFALFAVSRASPPLIRIPFVAPFPVPTIIAVGVAKPRAQGQAITRTETAAISAKEVDWLKRNLQERKVIIAIITTAGTK